MNQTLIVKLQPAQEQHKSLLETMEQFNKSCNYIAEIAFNLRTANKFRLQKVVYRDVRQMFGLSAQLSIRAISKVSEAYKRDRSIKPVFKPHSAIVYDQRILSWKGLDRVSLVTVNGRLVIPIRIGAYQETRIDRKVRQTDLILRNGTFYLAVVIDVPEPTADVATGDIGVDLGVTNLAVDSDGKFYSGEDVDKVRTKTDELKASLQNRGTKSAKRHLKRLSGKESRFRRNVNHDISKKLVSKAKDTHCCIALENLKGISERTVRKIRHSQRRKHKSWAFFQLRSFIEYKAKLAGVMVRFVNPAYTSQECPRCHHIAKSNRKCQSKFVCQQCGLSLHADVVGAINISHRASVNVPIVSPVPTWDWAGASP